jgi:ribonuclease P protein component
MIVVHLGTDPGTGRPPRAGLVVGKAVGNAVHRNRVKRRLRHLLRDRLPGLPDEAALVVRALPPAATASSTELGAALDRALSRLRPGGVRR